MDSLIDPLSAATSVIHVTDRHSARKYPSKLEDILISYYITKNFSGDGQPQKPNWKAIARMDIGRQHYTATDEREYDKEDMAWHVAELLASVLADAQKQYTKEI